MQNELGCAGRGGEPPVSLAEFTLNGHGGQDYYDVSLVDGYNLPVFIEPKEVRVVTRKSIIRAEQRGRETFHLTNQQFLLLLSFLSFFQGSFKTNGGKYDCKRAGGCTQNLNDAKLCPEKLRLTKNGKVR